MGSAPTVPGRQRNSMDSQYCTKLVQHGICGRVVQILSAGQPPRPNGMSDYYNARIRVGNVATTPAAFRLMLMNGVDPYTLLNRHATGDWSEMDAEDQQANRDAARTGLRVFSAFWVNEHERVWVITEADRSSTTFLLPDEY